MTKIVNYTYVDGGNFSRRFRTIKEARDFCIVLMNAKNIAWVQGLSGDTQFFPRRG